MTATKNIAVPRLSLCQSLTLSARNQASSLQISARTENFLSFRTIFVYTVEINYKLHSPLILVTFATSVLLIPLNQGTFGTIL